MKLAIYKHDNSPQMGVVLTEDEWVTKLLGRAERRLNIEWDPASRTILLTTVDTAGYSVRSYETRRGMTFETRVAVIKMGFPINQAVASIDVSHATVFGSGWARVIIDQTGFSSLLPPSEPVKAKSLNITGMDDLKAALDIINDAAATIPGVHLRVDEAGKVRARVEVDL